jgi:APA family basic amino acid/polyamine antiporter
VLMNYRKSMLDIFTYMILLATTATLVMYLVCALATLKMLRSGQLAASGKYTVWLAVTGVLGALYALWALIGAGKEAVLWGFVLLALGVPVFYAMRRHKTTIGQPSRSLD